MIWISFPYALQVKLHLKTHTKARWSPADNLLNADPLNKLIFSVHTYWPSTGNAIIVTDAQMTTYMSALGAINAPILIGEIAHDEVQANGIYPINYQLLLNLAQTHDIGYLIWWWGLLEGGTSPLYITSNGLTPA